MIILIKQLLWNINEEERQSQENNFTNTNSPKLKIIYIEILEPLCRALDEVKFRNPLMLRDLEQDYTDNELRTQMSY